MEYSAAMLEKKLSASTVNVRLSPQHTVELAPHVLAEGVDMLVIHGTVISFGDIVSTVSRALFSAIPAAGLGYLVILLFGEKMSPLVRLITANAVLFLTYFSVLLFAAGQKRFYVDLLRGMMATASKERDAASAS